MSASADKEETALLGEVGAVSDMSFPEKVDLLARYMVRHNDLGLCSRALGLAYTEAWKAYKSDEYAMARMRVLAEISPENLATPAENAARLLREADNMFDGTQMGRIAAVKALNEMLGYNKPTEQHLTIDTKPGIKLSLAAADGEEALEEMAAEVFEGECEDVEE